MNVLKFEIDFGKWNPTELHLEEFIILSVIASDYKGFLAKYKNSQKTLIVNTLDSLQSKGYIKILEDDELQLRQKSLDMFKVINTNTSDWIDEWRKLFPPGSNVDGFRYRGDKQGCLRKMNKFLKIHRAVSIEQIHEATKRYIERYKQKNYAYMKQAHYFIDKDGVSTLASEIESLIENEYESTTRRRTRILK